MNMETNEMYRKLFSERFRSFIWDLFWQINVIFKYFSKHIEATINYLLHNRDVFENKLTIITKVKDEAENIKEWIEYHKMVGADKFVIYDNESVDNLKEVLQPYIDSGEVDYIYQPGNLIKIQVDLANQAIRKYRNKTQWILVIDVDEFIVPVNKTTIFDAINEIECDLKKKIQALAMVWVMYGYSGHKTKPEGLVIENYTKNDGINPHIKTIVNPRLVVRFDVHYAICLFGMPVRTEKGIIVREGKIQNLPDASIEKIRINHYYTKSYEEFLKKCYIRSEVLNIQEEERDVHLFDPDLLSHHEDRIMEKFIPQMKELMK